MADAGNGDIVSREVWLSLKRKKAFNDLFPEKSGSDLAGLVFQPKKVYFQGQNSDETIFMLLRRHWITNVGWIFNLVVYLILPFIIVLFLQLFGISALELLGAKLSIYLLIVYYSIQFTYFYRHLVDWYFNLYLVTDERVVDYDFEVFKSRGVSESSLTSIEDVKETQIGVLPSFFNYGLVEIFSAADKNVIRFHQVPNPTLIRDKVTDLSKLAKEKLEK